MKGLKLTLADTVRSLFGIDPAECDVLKDRANSFARNKLVAIVEEPVEFGRRNRRYVAQGQDTVLFNALLLNAVFPDPKHVKEIFENPEKRAEATQTLKMVLVEQSSICGVGLRNPEALKLVAAMEGEWDLKCKRLPNPFVQLPQAVLGKHTNLLQVLLAQSAALAPMDTVLMTYLKGDLERAYELLGSLPQEQLASSVLANKIKQTYQEAREFDDLLDLMRPF